MIKLKNIGDFIVFVFAAGNVFYNVKRFKDDPLGSLMFIMLWGALALAVFFGIEII